MRSELFAASNSEVQTNEKWVLQNHKMLRVNVAAGRDVLAWKGSMVAFQGQVKFEHFGSQNMGQMFKKMLSSDNVPLMKVSGEGEVFFANAASDIHIIQLEGESICVNGSSLLAFDANLQYDLQRLSGVGMMAGGVWNTTLTGHGFCAITTDGQPVILDCSSQPTFTDIDATVGWSGNLKPGINKSVSMNMSLLKGGSGEAMQFAFQGPGFVVVQPSEARRSVV
jgi:uncharacterized protein (AIM24 family)